ncbi:MAG: CHASE2 domain-containing protein, partial [Porphyrobacter sp.]|nr:CHASE2 domain-containing protein [Porphyrobacter sp.]
MTDTSARPAPRFAWLARGWRNVREAGNVQLGLTLMLACVALLIARYSWVLPGGDVPTPLTGEAERALYDLRAFYAADLVEEDKRVVLVVYTDQTLIAARKRSPLDRGLLAKALRTLDSFEPRAIGIDILFDQPQDEDDELVATLRGMKTPVAVAYAAKATNPDDIEWEQQQYLEEFMARLEGSKAKPASIRLDNTFGATRLWPDIRPGLPPLLGRAMLADAGEPASAFANYEGPIDYRRPRFEESVLFPPAQIDLFADPDPEILPFLKAQYAGKYILIGGDIVDYDRVETTFTSINGEVPPGISVHAEIIAQILDNRVLTPIPTWVFWVMAVLAILAGVVTALLEWPARRLALLGVAQLV